MATRISIENQASLKPILKARTSTGSFTGSTSTTSTTTSKVSFSESPDFLINIPNRKQDDYRKVNYYEYKGSLSERIKNKFRNLGKALKKLHTNKHHLENKDKDKTFEVVDWEDVKPKGNRWVCEHTEILGYSCKRAGRQALRARVGVANMTAMLENSRMRMGRN